MKFRISGKGLVIGLLAACACILPFKGQTAYAMTTKEIQQKMDDYCRIIRANYSTPHWNANKSESQLKDAINRGDLLFGVTGNACSGRGNNHVRETGGCVSNKFNNQAQCLGFSKYFEYYLYGDYPRTVASDVLNGKTQDGFIFYKKGDNYPGLLPGDYILWTTTPHAAIVYEVKDGTIYVVDCNTGSDPCVIHLEAKIWIPNASGKDILDGNETSFKSLYDAGKAYIARRTDTTVCNHAFLFVNDDTVKCKNCGAVYIDDQIPLIPVNDYMDVTGLNQSSKTAPAHKTYFGGSTITNRYKKGDSVYVIGYAYNGYGNKWYKLSDGDWLTGSYLSAHMHTSNSKGVCVKCTKDYTITKENNVVLKVPAAKNGKVYAHTAPDGDAKTITLYTTSLTITGKTVNSAGNVWYRLSNGYWVYSGYVESAKQLATVKISGGLALNDGPAASPGGSREIAALPNGATVWVYPSESVGNWYAVEYNGKVGYAYGRYITALGDTSVKVEPPKTNKAQLLYPTNATYVKKISVSSTNAVLCINIRKDSGTSITISGIILYDANGDEIKNYSENVTNVSKSNTNFHSWFDVNKELKVTLSRGTTYKYKFYAVIDGETYWSDEFSFTTSR